MLVDILDSLLVRPLRPKESELKVAEKPSAGILYAERNERFCITSLLRESISFEQHFETEGIWKKLNAKFEFRGPAYEIVKTSYREKKIFYSRNSVFFRLISEVYVDKKKKKWNERELWIQPSSEGILLINCFE